MMRMGSRRRRIIARVVVFLLLGAIVNVAVAWGCATLLDVTDGEFFLTRIDRGNGVWRLAIDQRMGAVRVYSEPSLRDMTAEDLADRSRIPHWSRVQRESANAPGDGDALGHFDIEDGRGWPALSLFSAFDRHSYDFKQEVERRLGVYPNDDLIRSAEFAKVGGYQIAPGDCVSGGVLIAPPGIGSRDYRALPMLPIWPGFAINTVFYAAIVWMLFAAPFALRRWRRRRHGLCTACGYDLRGGAATTTCPECGATIAVRLQAQVPR